MTQPDRKWRVVGIIGVLAAAVVVCLSVPGPGKRPQNVFNKPQEPPQPPQEPVKHGADLPFELVDGNAEFGNPEAAVRLVVFIPGQDVCGNETAVLVHSLALANKDRLLVEVVDFQSGPGQKRQQELGGSCAGLMINGKQVIDMEDEGGNKVTLDFTSNVGETYQEDQLLRALDWEFEQAYGEKCKRPEPKPDPDAAPPAAEGAAAPDAEATE